MRFQQLHSRSAASLTRPECRLSAHAFWLVRRRVNLAKRLIRGCIAVHGDRRQRAHGSAGLRHVRPILCHPQTVPEISRFSADCAPVSQVICNPPASSVHSSENHPNLFRSFFLPARNRTTTLFGPSSFMSPFWMVVVISRSCPLLTGTGRSFQYSSFRHYRRSTCDVF